MIFVSLWFSPYFITAKDKFQVIWTKGELEKSQILHLLRMLIPVVVLIYVNFYKSLCVLELYSDLGVGESKNKNSSSDLLSTD